MPVYTTIIDKYTTIIHKLLSSSDTCCVCVFWLSVSLHLLHSPLVSICLYTGVTSNSWYVKSRHNDIHTKYYLLRKGTSIVFLCEIIKRPVIPTLVPSLQLDEYPLQHWTCKGLGSKLTLKFGFHKSCNDHFRVVGTYGCLSEGILFRRGVTFHGL